VRAQGADLRGEDEPARPVEVDERLLAHAVPRDEQLASARVPQGEGEHAAQHGQAALAVLAVQRQQHLGVARGAEDLALLFKNRAKRAEVVDLAVEDDDVAGVRVVHGLASARVQVQDGQARVPQGHVPAGIKPAAGLVRAAVAQKRQQGRKPVGGRAWSGARAQAHVSADAAHAWPARA